MVKTPYWLHFLRSPANVNGLIGCMAGAFFASLPWGAAGVGLVVSFALALETVAVTIVPGLPWFRRWVDERVRSERVAAAKDRLIEEVRRHGGSKFLENYKTMAERVASLYRVANDRTTWLSLREVHSLEDATLEYLRLCVADAFDTKSKAGPGNIKDVRGRLEQVVDALGNASLSAGERAQYSSAERELRSTLQSFERLEGRRARLQAALLSMPPKVDELYQMILSAPTGTAMTSQVEESLVRLRVSEDISVALDEELGEVGQAAAGSVNNITSTSRTQRVGVRQGLGN